jgi:hypothetical protein
VVRRVALKKRQIIAAQRLGAESAGQKGKTKQGEEYFSHKLKTRSSYRNRIKGSSLFVKGRGTHTNLKRD